jgi:hypothetical protein
MGALNALFGFGALFFFGSPSSPSPPFPLFAFFGRGFPFVVPDTAPLVFLTGVLFNAKSNSAANRASSSLSLDSVVGRFGFAMAGRCFFAAVGETSVVMGALRFWGGKGEG